jgi:ferrous iron transport protein A
LAVSLSTVETGADFEIEAVGDGTTRARLLRLGFLDGAVECRHRVRNGPVIIRRNGTELAVGRPVAQGIEVAPVEL